MVFEKRSLLEYKYSGYYYDTETNLYYLNSRYYNPNIGRFLNADGIIGANQDILSYNLYAYTSNNPINFSDPSGENIFKDIWNGVKYVFTSLTKNFVFEVGGGTGTGVGISILGVGVNASRYTDNNSKYVAKKGIVECNVTHGTDIRIAVFGYTKETTTSISCDKNEMSAYDEKKYKTYLSVGPIDFDEKDSTFVGGHIKIGWDIPKNPPMFQEKFPGEFEMELH